jgi:hypothetical protein
MRRIEVNLSPEEVALLKKKIASGTSPAREIQHARILLGSFEGLGDEQVSREAMVSKPTVWSVRRLYAEGGLDAALRRKPQPPRPEKRKVTDDTEARLVALACSAAPEGRNRWTLRLLSDHAVRLGYAPAGLSHESVRQALKKTSCVLGKPSAG